MTRKLLFLFLSLGLFVSQAQITTSSIRGTVVDDTGGGMPGATVVAVHTPTGTQYGAITLSNGKFNIPNLRVGGRIFCGDAIVGG